MGYLFFDELAIGTHKLPERNLAVPNLHLTPFPKQPLDELHGWALPQIVCSRLEAEAQDGDFSSIHRQYSVYGAVQVRLVTNRDRPQKGCVQVELFCAIGKRAEIFRQTGPTKRKTWSQVGSGNVQAGVCHKDLHHSLAIYVQTPAERPDLISKRDFQRMEGVTGIFHHLGHFQRRFQDWPRNVMIEFPQRLKMRGI